MTTEKNGKEYEVFTSGKKKRWKEGGKGGEGERKGELEVGKEAKKKGQSKHEGKKIKLLNSKYFCFKGYLFHL